jgi:ATP/maltotriose-dependent transcriptional regulator MalT
VDVGDGLESALAEARAAHERRRYDLTYALLRETADTHLIPVDDLALLADAAWWLGRVSEVLALTEQLHHRYLAEGQVDRAALHALDLAGVLFMSGRHAPAMGWLNRGRRLLDGRPRCAGHGVLAYVEASEALATQQVDDALERAGTLADLGRELGDETFSALALMVEGLAQIRRGELGSGFGLLDEAMLPVVAERVAPEWAGNIYCTIVSTCLALADLQRAREWVEATERWVEKFSDAVMFVGVCRAHRVELLVVEGAWATAQSEAQRVVADLAQLNAAAVAEAEYQLGESLRLRGDTAGARGHYRRAADLGRDPQPGIAYAELAEGRPGDAWAQICAAVGDDAEPFACARLLRAQVDIGLATGHIDTVAAAVRRLGELRDTFDTPGFNAWADEAAGAALLAQGRAAEALPLLRRAASGHRRIGATLDRALVERRLAEAHRVLGDAVACRSCEETAAALLRRLDVAAPAPPGREAASRPGGLTTREIEVLQQVATGASNRDAARALNVSEATLRRHLANVYAKLGVGSRTAAAAWAHEHELTHRHRPRTPNS